MKETKNVKSRVSRSVLLMATLGLLVVLIAGCQQANNPANSNTATNSNANANANASTAKSFKNDLTGTWVGIDDPKKKVTFTADEMIAFEDGKETRLKYTRLSDDEIEVTLDGAKKKAKTTFEGDSLTIAGDEVVKFKRESAANANNQATEKPPEIKAFENNLLGAWVHGDAKRVFTNDSLVTYDKGKLVQYTPYRILDKETVEMLGTGFTKDRIKITFADNNSTLDWSWADGNGFAAKRESNKTDVIVGDSLFEKIAGFWVGISGTNSDKEKISIFNVQGERWILDVNDKPSFDFDFTVQDNKTVVFQNGTKKAVSVDGDVMTVEENGETKKYNRLKTVD